MMPRLASLSIRLGIIFGKERASKNRCPCCYVSIFLSMFCSGSAICWHICRYCYVVVENLIKKTALGEGRS